MYRNNYSIIRLENYKSPCAVRASLTLAFSSSLISMYGLLEMPASTPRICRIACMTGTEGASLVMFLN